MIRWYILGLVLLVSGCSVPPPTGSLPDPYSPPQSFGYFAAQAPSPLFSPETQAVHAAHFKERFFAPWHDTNLTTDTDLFYWPWQIYIPSRGYGANTLTYPDTWYQRLAQNANPAAYPSSQTPAITVTQLDLRNFPTDDPLFFDFKKPGEGFPFDYLQNSTLHAGVPVMITHATRKGDWLYIVASHAAGWVHPGEIATVAPSQQSELETGTFIAVTVESTPLYFQADFLASAGIGTLLFLPADTAAPAFPQRNTDGTLRMVPVDDDSTFSSWPMRPDAMLLATLGDQLLGEPYGWGGLYGHRDCSSSLRDLFIPFGVWLPRNSSQQARFGDLLPLPQEEKSIVESIGTYGIPFASFVAFPGHIGLYLGQYRGQPIIFQQVWGLRTPEGNLPGRFIIGRAVISSLAIGRSLPGGNARDAAIGRRVNGISRLPGLETPISVPELLRRPLPQTAQ